MQAFVRHLLLLESMASKVCVLLILEFFYFFGTNKVYIAQGSRLSCSLDSNSLLNAILNEVSIVSLQDLERFCYYI